MFAECLLHWMQRAIWIGDPFYGQDVRSFQLPNEDSARLHGLTIDVHHACAALGSIAADMCAGEPQVLAQELHQESARINITGDGLAVHRQCNGGHAYPPE